jgi:response regulator RpfG family c-di-GMP phosphodiesterase
VNSGTSSSTRTKVLVVDDVQTNLTVFAKVVAQLPDTEAVCFTSAKDALQWLKSNECVLIIVDQSMPELSGIEFISEVRTGGNSATPIVMITGHSEKELQREALKRGASAFLGKPVDPVAFVSLARNLIQLRGARLETMAKAGAAHADQQTATEALFAQERATLDALVKIIDLRDPRTGDHCRRVALFSEAIASKLGLSMIEVTQLAQAARIHDIGKVSMPDRLLYKASRLLGDEREAAKKHVTDGTAMTAGLTTPIMHAANEIIHSHHERFDGSGYPSKLAGVAIPIFARIVAVADTFSALTSRRPWREAASVSIAVEQIEKESGFGFEPKIVGAFRDVMPELLDIRAEVPDHAQAVAR